MDIIHAQERLITIYVMINKKILKLFKLPQVYFYDTSSMALCLKVGVGDMSFPGLY